MLGDEREHAIVDLDRIEGGEAQARQVRDLVQYAFDQKAERRLAGKIGAIARDINAGQHDFPIASIHQRLDIVDHSARGDGAAVAATIRNDTECAAMVAAILHLQQGTGVIGKRSEESLEWKEWVSKVK